MTENEQQELLTLVKDNNRMIKEIWTTLMTGTVHDDLKDFTMNVLANLCANKV